MQMCVHVFGEAYESYSARTEEADGGSRLAAILFTTTMSLCGCCSHQQRALMGRADRLPLGWILQRRDNGEQFMFGGGVGGGSYYSTSDDVRLPPHAEQDGQRYALGRGQRLSCFRAQIPNKKFLVAKPLYLEGHF